MTNIIYCYTEGTDEIFPEAWNAAKNSKFVIKFHLTPVADDYAYYEVLNSYWGKDDLLMIERSVVVTDELIQELLCCDKRVCCHYYKSSPGYSLGTFAIGCRIASPISEILFQDTMPGLPEYVTFSGCGFLKIGKEFMKAPLSKFRFMLKKPQKEPQGDWISADNAIITSINSWMNPQNSMLAFHVHKQIKHLRSR